MLPSLGLFGRIAFAANDAPAKLVQPAIALQLTYRDIAHSSFTTAVVPPRRLLMIALLGEARSGSLILIRRGSFYWYCYINSGAL